MKFQRNDKYTSIAIYAFLVLLAAMVANIVLQNMGIAFGWISRIAGFISPVVYGFVFAFLLNPLLRKLDDKLLTRLLGDRVKPSARRVLALVLTYLIALAAIIFFIALVVPQLVISLRSIINNISVYVGYIQSLYGSFTTYMGTFSTEEGGTEIVNLLMGRLMGMVEGMLESAVDYIQMAVVPIITGAGRITASIINLLLGIIVSIYILMDREKLFAQLKKMAHAIFPDHVYDLFYDIGQDANRILSGFVIGKVIDSLIIGILCFIGMSILGLQYPVLISVIIGVTNVIPYFGPIIGAIPSAFLLVVNKPSEAVWFIIFVLLLQQFDGNILGPKILGDSIGLSALWIIFSIMLFSGLFGVLGMFIGVPLFAILYSITKRFIAFLLTRKGKSANTRDYDSDKNPLIK